MKIKLANFKLTLKINVLVFSAITVLVLLCSIFFSSPLEFAFNLKPNMSGIAPNTLQVHFVDVGQGDAILIRFPNNQTMLVDSGPKFAKDKLFYYINNVFFNNNEREFDYVMLTHSDEDHAGNMVQVLDSYKVNTFFRPHIFSQNLESEVLEYNPSYHGANTLTYDLVVQKLHKLQNEGMQVLFSEGGQTIKSDNEVVLELLAPNKQNYSNNNDFSPIVLVEFNNFKFMLTGDATSVVESEVLSFYNEEYLDVDVLKLGHHGSATSTSYEFLSVVKPEYAIVSAGKNNSYNHPSAQVISTIEQYDEEFSKNLSQNILQTQNVGNIVFYFNDSLEAKTMFILNVQGYLFIEWYVVGLSLSGVVVAFSAVKGVSINTGKASRV